MHCLAEDYRAEDGILDVWCGISGRENVAAAPILTHRKLELVLVGPIARGLVMVIYMAVEW